MHNWPHILDIDFLLAARRCLIVDRVKLELNRLVLQKLDVLDASKRVVEQFAGVGLIAGHHKLRVLASCKDAVQPFLFKHFVVKENRLLANRGGSRRLAGCRIHQRLSR